MILSDVISQANNATLSTSLDALLSQANGTGITAIVIAIVGIVAAFVEYLRRSQQATVTTANVAKLDNNDTVLNTKVETKADELHNKTNQLETNVETKADELHKKTNQL